VFAAPAPQSASALRQPMTTGSLPMTGASRPTPPANVTALAAVTPLPAHRDTPPPVQTLPAAAVAQAVTPVAVLPAAASRPTASSGPGFAPGTIKTTGPAVGTLKGFAVAAVSMFDDKGRWLRQVPASTLPSIPANGVAYHDGPKSLVLVTLGGRELLLDRTELTLESASRVNETCAQLERKGLTVRTGGAAMGHGRCRS